jgi:hypothetical protein
MNPNLRHTRLRPARRKTFAALCLTLAVCALVFGGRALAASTLYVNPDGLCGGNSPCFTTIQAAVNAAAAGDTINVAAGTYVENVNVNKALTLLGPNANINPNTGTRVAEAVIVPATSDPLNPSFAGPITVYLSASGVTFKGFTVDGDNPSLTSGVVFNGSDVDAEFGVYGDGSANLDAVVEHNIVKNVGEIAVWLNTFGIGGSRNANSRMNANKVDNVLGAFGQALRISDDAWADVTRNVVTRSRVGIVIENFSGNVTTHPASQIAENSLSTFRIGIRHNLHYVYANPGFTITRNSVSAYSQSPMPPQVTTPTAWQGIRVESVQQTVAVDVIDNEVDGNRATLQGAGYTRIEGLNVTNAAATSPNIRFRLNNVTDNIRGVFHETPAVPTLTCNNITGNTSGIVVDANATNGLVANNNNIVGNPTIGVQNNNGALNVNAQSNWWGAANGPGPVGPGSGDKVSTNVDYSNWLTAEGNCAAPCATNVARASYGATATASSQYSAAFPASGVINGEHNGNDWGAGGGWNDGTRAVFPDSVEVNLNVTQTVDAIDVYTLKNAPNNGSTVSDLTPATSYGIRDFEVQTWNGAAWVTAATFNGNTRAKRRVTFATPVSTSKVRVVVNGSNDTLYSRVVEVEVFSCAPAVVPTPTPIPTPTPSPTPCDTLPSNNVARATNGSTAVASSTVNANFPASGVINGERNGNTWGSGGGWNDGTRGVFPDNVQVNFNATQTISQIDVYTLKNAPNNGSTVDDTTPATSYGIKNFTVEYWTGTAWAVVPGGTVVNNTLAKRKFVFAPVTTDSIRVVITASNDNTYSRIVEIEAFSCSPVTIKCVNNLGEPGCHVTIQGAIDASSPNGQVNVRPGNYFEDVNVNKAGLKLFGSGAGSTTITGPIGGAGTTVQITANTVTVAGFTVTREGNNTTDWNDPGLNSAGFAIQGLAVTGAVIRDNVITGNRTAIDINNSNGHTVRNNTIDFNRTGLIYRNQTDFQTVVENFITNNWTVGVLFLDASGGTNSPVQTALHSTFSNNNISANWYGQVVDRQTGGSLPAPNTTNLKNFRGNWWGTTSPVVTTANSAEPGYAAQIPVAYGGTATPPGGQPDIAGPASANIQYLPLLTSGTDTNVETTPGRGTNGFQGVPNTPLTSPGNQQNWVISQSSTATVSFVAGPGTPPLGAGSGQLSVGSDGNSGAQFRQTVYNGTRLDDLTELKYSTYTSNDGSVPMTGDQTAYIILNVDLDANGTNDTLLFFEPEYQSGYTGAVPDQGNNVLNTWQTWDALAGGWWSTTGAAGANPGADVKPLSTIIAAFPNAVIHNSPTTGSVRLVAGFGAGSWDNYVGNVDRFLIRQNGALVTYNFEQVP